MKALNDRLFEFVYNEIKKHRKDFSHKEAEDCAATVCRMCKTEGEVRAFLTSYMKNMYNGKT